jgi:redox-regulated HSP33 family molecular chaperone
MLIATSILARSMADRGECATRKVMFHARCPEDHFVGQDFERSTLRALLEKNEAIELYCERCNTSWTADAKLVKRLRTLLDLPPSQI